MEILIVIIAVGMIIYSTYSLAHSRRLNKFLDFLHEEMREDRFDRNLLVESGISMKKATENFPYLDIEKSLEAFDNSSYFEKDFSKFLVYRPNIFN